MFEKTEDSKNTIRVNRLRITQKILSSSVAKRSTDTI